MGSVFCLKSPLRWHLEKPIFWELKRPIPTLFHQSYHPSAKPCKIKLSSTILSRLRRISRLWTQRTEFFRVRYRWKIFLVNIDPVVGSEQGKTRPVLVISAEEINQILPVVNVLPLTTLKPGLGYP